MLFEDWGHIISSEPARTIRVPSLLIGKTTLLLYFSLSELITEQGDATTQEEAKGSPRSKRSQLCLVSRRHQLHL